MMLRVAWIGGTILLTLACLAGACSLALLSAWGDMMWDLHPKSQNGYLYGWAEGVGLIGGFLMAIAAIFAGGFTCFVISQVYDKQGRFR